MIIVMGATPTDCLVGFQHKIDENLYQGYSLGFSKSKLTLDAGEGNTKTNTIHANVFIEKWMKKNTEQQLL
jgi:hypothetical protein